MGQLECGIWEEWLVRGFACEASLFVRGFVFRARLRSSCEASCFHRAPYLAELLKTARYLAAEQFEGLRLGADRGVELAPVEDRRTRLGGDGEEVAHNRRAAAELSRLDECRLRLGFWKMWQEVGARQFGRDKTVIFGFSWVFFSNRIGWAGVRGGGMSTEQGVGWLRGVRATCPLRKVHRVIYGEEWGVAYGRNGLVRESTPRRRNASGDIWGKWGV